MKEGGGGSQSDIAADQKCDDLFKLFWLISSPKEGFIFLML
jgi:hypothetical protein